jgi:hypothetical protein
VRALPRKQKLTHSRCAELIVVLISSFRFSFIHAPYEKRYDQSRLSNYNFSTAASNFRRTQSDNGGSPFASSPTRRPPKNDRDETKCEKRARTGRRPPGGATVERTALYYRRTAIVAVEHPTRC